MQKLCCVRTRQHPLPVWSHKFVISSLTHFSINSHPFWWELYQVGSTVGPTVLSLAILNNLVLTMSSQIGNTKAKRRTQKLENLHYYVLGTLFPFPVHLVDDQHSEFLESWMAYQEFDKFPDLIEYYTTMEMVHYLRKSTLQSKKVHYLRTSNTSCTLPNGISLTTHPTKSYTYDYTNTMVKNILHYYWSISYPIQLLDHHAKRPNLLGVSSR